MTTLTFESELKIVSGRPVDYQWATYSLVAALYFSGKEMQKPMIIANKRI